MFAISRRVCSCLRRFTVARSSWNAAPSPKLASVVASTCCRAALHDRNVSISMPLWSLVHSSGHTVLFHRSGSGSNGVLKGAERRV